MKVYKFGGASVKDANGIRNLSNILKEVGFTNTLLVLSAMGKITNAFEKIVDSYFNKKTDLKLQLENVKSFHYQIVNELFQDKDRIIFDELNLIFNELNTFIENNSSTDFDFIYDQIVSKAELISTKICSAYLQANQINNQWLDVRKCIKTNSDFRRAKVDWEVTNKLVNKNIDQNQLYITQGFIASDNNNITTTLGREGSDYTAGILAYCLEAKEVIIFKDVEGVLNADPRKFKRTTLLNQISYKEAIEMSFYGASVIHPKTLQPLQRKEIPLYVKSFIHPLHSGTMVSKGVDIDPKTACYIVKDNQILLSLSAKNFSFIMEDDISEIFDYFHQYKIKVNLIQNSAISFSVCIEDNFNNFKALFEELKINYICYYNKNVSLFTIRHFNDDSIRDIEKDKEVLVKQLSRETMQIVVKN